MGFVVPQFKEGTLLLEGAGGKKLRLVWEKPKQKKIDRRRALPPGKYRIRNYTLSKQDKAGTRWLVSATGHSIRQILIKKGRTTPVNIGQMIYLKPRAKFRGRNLHVGIAVQGDHHSGLTIYKAGKRIPIKYSISDSKNRELTSGVLKYG